MKPLPEVFSTKSLVIDRQTNRQTDRQTDGRTVTFKSTASDT